MTTKVIIKNEGPRNIIVTPVDEAIGMGAVETILTAGEQLEKYVYKTQWLEIKEA